ncbi:MAG: hypothetical protein GF355_05095 [Candidatus Eisenbacteria bacterium]|nr:hypothetical protein [Candidatus Eisenbacteria bacterium]
MYVYRTTLICPMIFIFMSNLPVSAAADPAPAADWPRSPAGSLRRSACCRRELFTDRCSSSGRSLFRRRATSSASFPLDWLLQAVTDG